MHEERRSDLIQLCVFIPELRLYLAGEKIDESLDRWSARIIQAGDREIAATITDAEVAEARKTEAAKFANDFPAGI